MEVTRSEESVGEADGWSASLTPEKRAAIRDLHRLRPAWNLVAILFAALWAGTLWLMIAFPVWLVRIPGYVVIGMLIHAMAVLMHEGIHGSLFRNRALDRGFGFVLGAPALFSATAYRVTHMNHHRHNRTALDPDEFTNVSKLRWIVISLFYAWGLAGIIVYVFHVPIMALLRGTRRQRLAVLLEYALLAMVYAGVILGALHFGWFPAVLHGWIIPLFFANLFGNFRGWAEHMMTRAGHPLIQTRTVTSNGFVSFFMCNLNYHLEHHLFPAMPWYHLPRLHRLLQEDYRQAGSVVYRSYSRFIWDAVKTGPYGLALQSLPTNTVPTA
jgi:fatty acid desaturase